ncbi:predicted protein [Phaeodactylum tricornutum CCAP 1055/1]|uniref:ESF1 RRM domain-containing protein n=2 Tax=Phaeodactylum tricornutum TaxID=2850 RepID=B7GAK3_PHATC|nr:predicted protein [Phaeodactylum tricornutum CCAP 1055/1]EEC44270.1 predicted protein [Phaeodactylum tricornutum CCAP 1055/1]|eukprot:XP_002184092.1 predicted protein [Phaeodactylum tricornutum CCAP 1055/1]
MGKPNKKDKKLRAGEESRDLDLEREESSKVKIDDRFASVLTDERFQLDVQDKYGRRRKQKDKATEELSTFYTVEDGHDKQSFAETEKLANNGSSDDSSASSSAEASEQGELEVDEDPASRIAYLTALSRGEVDVSSSSEGEGERDETDRSLSDSDDESVGGSEDPVLGMAGVLDPSTNIEEEVELTTEVSPFLAVMNMDWMNVRAVDIFAIVSSFTPPGAVKKVQVYPSDFGRERMAQEEKFGPAGLWKKSKTKNTGDNIKDDDDDNETDNLSAEDGGYLTNSEEDGDSVPENIEGTPSMTLHNSGKTDFDPEKLRAYEASRLKYYFAVVEFSSPGYADVAYKEVDGLEFEYSSSALDLRAIPPSSIDDVTKERTIRGKLGELWRKRTDLKAYLASDNSSDEEENEKAGKSSRMRKMLGLDSDDEDSNGTDQNSVSSGSSSEKEGEEKEDSAYIKEALFIPGKSTLEESIRSKLENKEDAVELTPWEKYQEKRKLKKREKRKESREKRKEINEIRKGEKPRKEKSGDSFFMEAKESEGIDNDFLPSQSKGELELLVAGENDVGEDRDYDMRGLQRLEKNKDKKFTGSRKRNEVALAANVTGTEFHVDTSDQRFKAVLDGTDDRFGIDRTDPSFKETPAMREILKEQTLRRKDKRRRKSTKAESASKQKVVPNVSAEATLTSTGGASALSSLVSSLKSKIVRPSTT